MGLGWSESILEREDQNRFLLLATPVTSSRFNNACAIRVPFPTRAARRFFCEGRQARYRPHLGDGRVSPKARSTGNIEGQKKGEP